MFYWTLRASDRDNFSLSIVEYITIIIQHSINIQQYKTDSLDEPL